MNLEFYLDLGAMKMIQSSLWHFYIENPFNSNISR